MNETTTTLRATIQKRSYDADFTKLDNVNQSASLISQRLRSDNNYALTNNYIGLDDICINIYNKLRNSGQHKGHSVYDRLANIHSLCT